MKSKVIALVLAFGGFGFSGITHAQATYSAHWELGGLEALRSQAESSPVAPALGQWGVSISHQRVTAQSPNGSDWSEPQQNATVGDTDVSSAGLIQPYGSLAGSLHTVVQDGGTRASAIGVGRGPQVSAEFAAAGGRAESQSRWTGYFSLNPHSAVTFDVLSVMSVQGAGSSAPLGAALFSQNFDADGRFLELAFSAAAGQLRNSLQMGIYDPAFSGDFRDMLSFQLNEANHSMAVTFTNDSDAQWAGWLRASSSLNAVGLPSVTGAVPEPATWASLLAGLAVMGALAKRRARSRF